MLITNEDDAPKGLLALPEELLANILSYLPCLYDIWRLSSVSTPVFFILAILTPPGQPQSSQ